MLGFGKKAQARRSTRARVRSGTSNFDAAGMGRLLKDWKASGDGANSALLHGLGTLRNRCRDMARNNPWCASALDSLVANVTDPGIKPISKALDEAFCREVRLLWEDWGHVADAHGVLSWDLLVGLAYRSMVESGEVFIRMRPRRIEDGLVVPLQVQVLEADHVPHTKNETAANGNKIVAGIEFDALNRRVAYHMYREHPGDLQNMWGGGEQTVRVPAAEVIHLFEPTRAGQVRGMPRLVPVLVRLRDLAKYEDAELVKKLVSSLIAGFITSPTPDADLMAEEEGEGDDAGNDAVSWAKMEPGTLSVLAPGEEVTFSNPPAADANYDAHVKMHLRAVAATYGLTYEQMTGDLTGVNFSSIRAGLNEFQRRARRAQRILMHQLHRVVWERWMDEAVLVGALRAPDYALKARDYRRVEWRAPGWKYVNPLQEIAAIKEEIKAGLRSRESVMAEQGLDVAEVDAQIAADYARAKELGLAFDTDPTGASQVNKNISEQVVLDPDAEETPPAPADAARSLLTLAAALEAQQRAEEQALDGEITRIVGDE